MPFFKSPGVLAVFTHLIAIERPHTRIHGLRRRALSNLQVSDRHSERLSPCSSLCSLLSRPETSAESATTVRLRPAPARLLLLAGSSRPPPPCHSPRPGIVHLDFENVSVLHNNLGGVGPDSDVPRVIWYERIARLDSTWVDLIVTNITYYDSFKPSLNGLSINGGAVGNLNLDGPHIGSPESDKVNVTCSFRFVESDTGAAVVLPKFVVAREWGSNPQPPPPQPHHPHHHPLTLCWQISFFDLASNVPAAILGSTAPCPFIAPVLASTTN